MNNYQIVLAKNENRIGIAQLSSTWWKRFLTLDLEIKVIFPELRDNKFWLDWGYYSLFSLSKPDCSESLVQDLSKVGDLIIKAEKLRQKLSFREVKIKSWELEIKEATSSGVNCRELQRSLAKVKEELIELTAIENSLNHLIFSAIGNSLREKATKEFQQQANELTQNVESVRNHTAELVNEIECHIQAYKMLFEQTSLVQFSSRTADLEEVDATELM